MLEFKRICEAFCDKPGLYEVPYPQNRPTGHLLIYIAMAGSLSSMTFVPDPVSIFTDSTEAFQDDDAEDKKPIFQGVMITEETENVLKFKRKSIK
jgi:hypothetical protein